MVLKFTTQLGQVNFFYTVVLLAEEVVCIVLLFPRKEYGCEKREATLIFKREIGCFLDVSKVLSFLGKPLAFLVLHVLQLKILTNII